MDFDNFAILIDQEMYLFLILLLRSAALNGDKILFAIFSILGTIPSRLVAFV